MPVSVQSKDDAEARAGDVAAIPELTWNLATHSLVE
jgi:hypothetical protein